MRVRIHPSRPGHSTVAWVSYGLALAALLGFLLVPYNEIRIYPGWDEDLGSDGWQLMREAWQMVVSPSGVITTQFSVSMTFGLLLVFSIVCVVPAGGLLWFAGHSRVLMWLGRIWWSLLVLPGFAWFFLLQNALATPGALDYLHREGMVCYWLGGLGVAAAFWITGRRDEANEPTIERLRASRAELG